MDSNRAIWCFSRSKSRCADQGIRTPASQTGAACAPDDPAPDCHNRPAEVSALRWRRRLRDRRFASSPRSRARSSVFNLSCSAFEVRPSGDARSRACTFSDATICNDRIGPPKRTCGPILSHRIKPATRARNVGRCAEFPSWTLYRPKIIGLSDILTIPGRVVKPTPNPASRTSPEICGFQLPFG